MRVNKFRVWDNIEKEMTGWEDIFEAYDAEDLFADPPHPQVVLMQFTGRKDNNGIEFFVGDIVKINMCYHNIIGIEAECIDEEGKGEAHYKVMFLENLNQFCLELIYWTKFKPRNKYMHLYKGEIIGNIYENPELLEVK